MTTATAQKVTLHDFLQTVEKERSYGMYVTGLIIRKGAAAPAVEEIAGAQSAVVARIAEGASDADILAKFREAFTGKRWLVLDLADGTLPPLWREQFSRLRNSNAVFVQGKTPEETFFAEQTADTRVVAVIDEQHLDAIEYPAFLNLFGPVAEL